MENPRPVKAKREKAMFGDRIMKSKAKDVEKEFTENLTDKLRGLA